MCFIVLFCAFYDAFLTLEDLPQSDISQKMTKKWPKPFFC